MAQRKTTPPATAGGGAEMAGGMEAVGPYVLGAMLRRDRLGELYEAEGPAGPARVRVTPALDDPEQLTAVLDRLATVRHPGVAVPLDQLVDGDGRVAIVSAADRYTLADRHRVRRLDAAAIGPLGCVLLDGLAALHSSGVAHGSATPAAVGIDNDGAPRWQDAGVLPALSQSRTPPALRRAADVADTAAMLRDLGRLPPQLEAVLDPTATGMPDAIQEAAALARAWRDALSALQQPVPPDGVRTRIPGLLPPTMRPGKARRPLPRWVRPAAAGALVAVALGIVPAAALGPYGGPVFDRIDAYAPVHKGMQLTYRIDVGGAASTVTLRVSDVRTVAGELTATLQPQGVAQPQQGSGASLPLGLGGSTMRIRSDAVTRTASGGAVRDLQLPLAPGTSWHDRRTGVIAVETIDEQRTVLGPVSLTVPAGHYQRCVALSLQSSVLVSGGSATGGSGLLWYCPGVGLARAHLLASGQPLDIELASVR
ncbi:MAG TPA: hypothetical protein VGQ42_08395 [Candidatus Dormibacteraeota bacterium]|jgi:hypothetical protein|nr:hypothetical protein [Candidatus Dormibacteraeota bacterium]